MIFTQRWAQRFLETAVGETFFCRVGTRLVPIQPEMDSALSRSLILRQGQALVNARLIGAYPDRFWPQWVQRQYLKASTSFQGISELPQVWNTSCRNATELRLPGDKAVSVIDPAGVVMPYPGSWSLEPFLQVSDQKVSGLSGQETYTQSADRGQITSKTVIQSVSIKSQSVISSQAEQEPVLLHSYQLTNLADKPQAGTFYLGVRPYNLEGVFPIKEIVYLSKNAFVMDDRLGVLFDQKPDNVVCHRASDGELGAHHVPMQMILSASCPESLAAGYVAYKFSLSPGETVSFSVRLPMTPAPRMRGLFEQVFSPNQTELLGRRIQSILRLSPEKEREAYLKRFSEYESGQLSARFPDAKQTRVFKQCRQQLLGYVQLEGLSVPKDVAHSVQVRDEIAIYMELLSLGSSEKVLQSLEGWLLGVPKRLKKMDPDELAGILSLIDHTYRINLDKAWLKDVFYLVDRVVKLLSSHIASGSKGLVKGLVRPTRSVSPYRQPEQYLFDTFAVLAGFEAATHIASRLHKDIHKNRYKGFAGDLLQALDIFLKKRHHEFPDNPLPVSVQTPMSEGLISLVSSVVPYGILKPTDARVTAITAQLEQLYCKDGAFFQSDYPAGLSIDNTLRMAEFYLAQMDMKFLTALDHVLDRAGELGQWPAAVHPQTQMGTSSLGSSPMAAVLFSRISRQLLARPMGNRLLIASPFSEKWLEKGKWKSKVERLVTPFGGLSYTVEKNGPDLQFHFQTEFHTAPTDFLFVFPRTITAMGLNGDAAQPVGKSKVKMPSDTQSVRFTF